MSIHRVGKGRNARWRVKWRESGKQRSRTFAHRDDAVLFDAEQVRIRQFGGVVQFAAPVPALGEFIETYWANHAVPNLAVNTRASYLQLWGKHIEPRLGHRALTELTPKVLNQWRVDLERAGVGAPTIRKAFATLQSILAHAVVEELVPRNAAHDVRKPRVPTERRPTPATPEQIEALRAHFLANDDAWSATVVALLAYAGLRTFSEIRDLRVGDLARKLRVYATKTRREDYIRVLAPLRADVTSWMLARGLRDPRAHLLTRADGQPLVDTDWRNWRRRVWQPAAAAVGLGRLDRTTRVVRVDGQRVRRETSRYNGMTPYDLRHSFASLLIWEGRTVAEVAHELRHSVQTCSRYYIHVFESYELTERVDAETRIRNARDMIAGRARRTG